MLPGAPWLLCAASVGVAAVLALRLERTIEAHAAAAAASPHVHSGGYDAAPAGVGPREEGGVKLPDRLAHGGHGAARGESRDGLMQGTVASHAPGAREEAEHQWAPGPPWSASGRRAPTYETS